MDRRLPTDPDEDFERGERERDREHFRLEALDLGVRHAPAERTPTHCATCGKPLEAQLTCAACGDEIEGAA